MNFTTTIDTTVGERGRTNIGIRGIQEFAVGTIDWENRDIEIWYQSEVESFEIHIGGFVGRNEDYSTLEDHEDAFGLWSDGTGWEATEKPDNGGVFIETPDPKEWEGRDLYSGTDLTAVAEEHFQDIDHERLIGLFEKRLDEIAEAISGNGSAGESITRIYDR